MAVPSDDLTLEMKRVLPAARSLVFGAFSDAKELAKWWGPKGFSTPSLDFDLRVGARYRIEMTAMALEGMGISYKYIESVREKLDPTPRSRPPHR